jgi:hypothetical protein
MIIFRLPLMSQDWDQWCALVNTAMMLQVPWTAANFITQLSDYRIL